MGKRKKPNLQNNKTESKIAKVENNTTDESEIQINTKIIKKVKSKKKNRVESADETVFIDSEVTTKESNSVTTESQENSKKNKSKKNNDLNEDNSLLDHGCVVQTAESSVPDETHSYDKKKVKNKKAKPDKEASEKNKNNLTSDEQDHDVETRTNNQKKGKKADLEQEDDVKDEDIDKFCDEIDEEDNQQYLNWVELLEAKLNPNKKKPK